MGDVRIRYVVILKSLLKEKKPLTAAALAAASGVSVRTVKYDIYELNRLMKPLGSQILSKPGEGYWIQMEGEDNLESLSHLLHSNLNQKKEEVFRYNYERIYYLIKRLLMADGYVKAEELMDEIFISRSTLTQDLKKARILLSRFRLRIAARANHGILIEGRETDKRLCIAEYFFRYNEKFQIQILKDSLDESGDWEEERSCILSVARNACRETEIMISEFLLADLATHILVALIRCRMGCYVAKPPSLSSEAIGEQERRAAGLIASGLRERFDFQLPPQETDYYALQLYSKKNQDQNNIPPQEHRKLEQCVDKILGEIKDNFEMDFYRDPSFADYLVQHIGQMVVRLKNHLVVKNPLLYENLRRYMFASKITHSADAIIERFYNVELDNNEFAYLVPCFNLEITKQRKEKKTTVGFLGGTGMPESFMYYNELLENLPSDTYEIIWAGNMAELENLGPVQFIITAYAGNPPCETPVYQIHDGNYIADIREALSDYQYKKLNVDQYLKPEFGCFNVEGDTRDEVMENFYSILFDRGLINRIPDPDKKFCSNEIGNGIVHVQDTGRIVRKAGYLVCVLRNPIFWEQDIVRVLVMIKTKREGDKNLPYFCDMLSKWAGSPEKVERLVRTKDYQVFRQDLLERRGT